MKKIVIMIFLAAPYFLFAQETKDDVEQILNNGQYRQWRVIGTLSHLGVKSCENGSGYYTFYKDTLVIQQCVNLSWEIMELPYSIQLMNEEPIVVINEKTYYFKKLNSSAPVCEGSEYCIRLSRFALHKDEYSEDIYLQLE